MTFKLHTYGCQMNVRDSEAVAALLEACGYESVEREEDADLVIVNTCSVRGKAEDKALGKLGLLCATKRERPERVVGVMGCMAQRLNEELFRRVPALDFAVGTRAAARVPGVLARILAGEGPICELGVDEEHAGAVPEDAIVTAHLPGQCLAFVTILLGCERRCSYCIVPDVRGKEYSRPPRDIVEEVRAIVRDGARDVTLLGQSVMNYGRRTPVDFGGWRGQRGYREPLPLLFEMIQEEVPELPRLRFTSGHPSGVTSELVDAMQNLPILCPHLHLPVQSGSDEILRRMRRGYTAEQYLEAVRELRAVVPDIALTSDIIVGFPGETEADFESTRALMDAADFDNAFIFKYSPRPGTPAAEWEDDVPAAEKARRNQVLLVDQDRRGVAINRRFIGRELPVLAEGPSLRNKKRWSGRSPHNKIIIFEPSRPVGEGDMISVHIGDARAQTLYGEMIK